MNFLPLSIDADEVALPMSAVSISIPEQPQPQQTVMKKKGNGWAAICRFGGVGDNLICASPLAGLKKKFGRVEVVTCEPFGVVFENNPHVDKLSMVDKSFIPQDSSGNWQRYFTGRSKEYDAFFHLSHSCETLLALFQGQTQFWWPASYRRKMCGKNYLETVHDVCEVPHEFGPLFFATEEEKEKAAETKKKIGDRFIVWVISGTRLDKTHPYAPMAIARLIREVGPVVMVGAPQPSKDYDHAKLIQQEVTKFNGTDAGLHLGLSPDRDNPTWPIRRVLSFAQTADVVIGPDTGPMWGVAFEQCKKVMLLSHASVENITKHWVNTITLRADARRVPCWPCHQLHDTGETCVPNKEKTAAACISDISVECILTAVKAAWGDEASLSRLRSEHGANAIVQGNFGA